MKWKLAYISGATSGLGKELAYLLSHQNIPLLITGKDEKKLFSLEKELSSFTTVIAVVADLSKPDDLKNVLEKITLLTPDLVLHTAGLGLYGEALSFTLEEQRLMIQVNIDAAVQVTLTAAAALKKKGKKGTIVNIGSMAGHFLYPRFALYAASKRFIEDFSLSLDEELKPFKIRSLIAVPGRFASPFLAKSQRPIPLDSWSVISLKKVAKRVLWQAEKQKARVVIDFRYKLLHALSLCIPSRILSHYL
jgi:short-subunit dehydrogenase